MWMIEKGLGHMQIVEVNILWKWSPRFNEIIWLNKEEESHQAFGTLGLISDLQMLINLWQGYDQ